MPANQSLKQPVMLLPCPFCGGEARASDQPTFAAALETRVGCKGCGANVQKKVGLHAIEQWNTRTPPSSDEQEVERASIRISELVCDDLVSRFDMEVPDRDWEDFSVKVCDIAADEIRNLSAMQDSGAIGELRAEHEALKHDFDRRADFANEMLNENEALKNTLRKVRALAVSHDFGEVGEIGTVSFRNPDGFEIAGIIDADLSKLEKGQ